MIDGLTPYSVYVDAGEAWLGRVPLGWEMLRTKTVLCERSEKGHPDEPLLAATQSKGVVKKEDYENRTVLALKDLQLLKLVREGDFVISLRSFQGGIEYARNRGIISPAYTVLYPRNLATHSYLAWLFKSRPYVENLSLHVTGIRQGQTIDYGRLARSRLPLPPVSEQAAIVSFLEHADGRMRRYIVARRQLIVLLNEQKQAIVHNAVTRGLDANVRLKASGVEWLGDVPEHWSVMRNKAMMSPRRRTVGLRSTDFTLLSLTLRGVIPRDLENPEGKFPADFGTYQVVEPGELVFCLFDMDETPRTVGIAPVRGMVTGAYSVFACIDRDTASFLYNFYLAMDAQKRLRPFYTGLRKVVQNDTFMSIRVAIPPHEEMRKILSTIVAETARIDGAIEHAEREVHLVQEFRTRLISDVVTGKLDVRQAAEQLPEVVEDAGPLDDDGMLDGDESEDEGDLDAVVGEVVA
jgi:type I restriction enzyme, S subunit